MKAAFISLGLTLISADALAIDRYTSSEMACADVQAVIRADGAAIVRHQSTRVPGIQLYGRYVRNGRSCTIGERLERVYIQASDTQFCRVRECREFDYDTPGEE